MEKRFRVYLRAIECDDSEVSFKWRNDKTIQKMVGGSTYFVSKEIERQWILENTMNEQRIILAICLVENDKYIGNVNIQNIDWINRTASVPILIGDKNEWGKGYATEARILALRFAFYERNLHKITDYVLEDNVQSLRLHFKCGYKQEGILREAVYKAGRYHNQIIMGLLREEFEYAYQKFIEKTE